MAEMEFEFDAIGNWSEIKLEILQSIVSDIFKGYR